MAACRPNFALQQKIFDPLMKMLTFIVYIKTSQIDSDQNKHEAPVYQLSSYIFVTSNPSPTSEETLKLPCYLYR